MFEIVSLVAVSVVINFGAGDQGQAFLLRWICQEDLTNLFSYIGNKFWKSPGPFNNPLHLRHESWGNFLGVWQVMMQLVASLAYPTLSYLNYFEGQLTLSSDVTLQRLPLEK